MRNGHDKTRLSGDGYAISIYFVYFSCFSFFSTLLLYHFVVVDWSISFLKETEKKREIEREGIGGWVDQMQWSVERHVGKGRR